MEPLAFNGITADRAVELLHILVVTNHGEDPCTFQEVIERLTEDTEFYAGSTDMKRCLEALFMELVECIRSTF